MSIQVTDLAKGEIIAFGALRIRILEDGTNTDHRLGIVEITLPPATPGPPQHVHREHDETFFVVAGTATFTCGSETIQATPGMLVTVPPHTAHTFANDGNVESVLLCTVTPDRYIGYFRELATLPPGRPDPAAIGAIMSRYATDIVRPPT